MKLFPFQEYGAAWLYNKDRAYLADEPGLGKTAQVISALKRAGAVRPVVICPASAVPVWQEQAELWGFPHHIMVMSYDMLVRHHAERAPKIRSHADALIFDEAHYLKSTDSLRSKLCLGREGIVTRGTPVWLLSGTPSPNHYGELFVPLAALWPSLLTKQGITNHEQFLDKFTRWGWVRHGSQAPVRKIYGSKNAAELKYLLNEHDVMLRRTMEDVGIQLPEIFWQSHPVRVASDLTDHERTEELELAVNVERLVGTESSFAAERRRLGERKVDAVAAEIAELLVNEPGRKHVVMAYHLSVLDKLEEMLGGFGLVRVDGGTTDRGGRVERFQSDPDCRVFLGQSVACREAITLTAASIIHIVEPFWTPEYNVQLAGRIRRLSQSERHVIARMYYDYESPLDAALTATLARKQYDMLALYDDDGA